ncbi:MAG: hypothetical protein WB445_01970 [Acinetobacter sp.]
MPLQTHILGSPRISAKRELKFAEESCWKGESAQAEFRAKAQAVQAASWQPQIEAA